MAGEIGMTGGMMSHRASNTRKIRTATDRQWKASFSEVQNNGIELENTEIESRTKTTCLP
jgi:hypothetical protein